MNPRSRRPQSSGAAFRISNKRGAPGRTRNRSRRAASESRCFPRTAVRGHPRSEVARPAGLEPATPGLEGRCSIQLSYGRTEMEPLVYPDLPLAHRAIERRPSGLRDARDRAAAARRRGSAPCPGRRRGTARLDSRSDCFSAIARRSTVLIAVASRSRRRTRCAGGGGDCRRLAERRQAGQMQRLARVDVADPGHHLLIEQRDFQRHAPARAGSPAPRVECA